MNFNDKNYFLGKMQLGTVVPFMDKKAHFKPGGP